MDAYRRYCSAPSRNWHQYLMAVKRDESLPHIFLQWRVSKINKYFCERLGWQTSYKVLTTVVNNLHSRDRPGTLGATYSYDSTQLHFHACYISFIINA